MTRGKQRRDPWTDLESDGVIKSVHTGVQKLQRLVGQLGEAKKGVGLDGGKALDGRLASSHTPFRYKFGLVGCNGEFRMTWTKERQQEEGEERVRTGRISHPPSLFPS